MENNSKHFNYENMGSGYQVKQDYADTFVKAAAELDKVITEEVNLPTGAIFSGNRGKKMWDNWTASASKYKDLYTVMTDTNTNVVITHNDYANTENTIAGGKLQQEVQDAPEIDPEALAASAEKLADLRQAAMLRSGLTDSDGVPIIDVVPGGTSQVTIGDRVYKVVFDDNGNIRFVTSTNIDGSGWQFEASFSSQTMEQALTHLYEHPEQYDYNDYRDLFDQFGTEGQAFWHMLCSNGTLASRGVVTGSIVSGLYGNGESGITIPSEIDLNSGNRYSNQEYAEAGKKILESSRNLLEQLSGGAENANQIVEYMNNNVFNSDAFENLPAAAQEEMRNDVAALQQYNEVTQRLEAENSWYLLRSDGAFGDWDSWIVDGWRGDYAAAYQNSVDAANDINNQLAGLMTIDSFTEKYGDILGPDLEAVFSGGVMRV